MKDIFILFDTSTEYLKLRGRIAVKRRTDICPEFIFMKPLLRLIPYLKRYKKILWLGLLTVFMSNIFTVIQPLVIGRAIDSLKAGLESGNLDETGLLKYAGMIVGLSLVAGIFTFLTRQTIIVVSRHVEST